MDPPVDASLGIGGPGQSQASPVSRSVLVSSAIMCSREMDNRVRKLGPHRRRDW